MKRADVTKPICKSAGGKGRLLGELVPRMPREFRRYLEPFCGGAAMFFNLPAERQKDATLGDINADLIDCYAAVAHDVDAVLAVANVHCQVHSREHYFEVRRMFNAEDGQLGIHERAAAYLYLSKASFNGLWRRNRAGAMNVPPGDYEKLRIDEDNLRRAAVVFGRAKLVSGDYRMVTGTARAGDLVFMDPPYDGTFMGYSAFGFSKDDQRDLAVEVTALARRGVHVMLTNSATDLVRELYRDFHITEILGPRSISRDGDGRKPVKELIVTTYEVARGGDSATHGRWYADNCELPFTPGAS